jgi:hypothetical protein
MIRKIPGIEAARVRGQSVEEAKRNTFDLLKKQFAET